MSQVYMTSDWHLDHRGIHYKLRPQFESVEHHNNTIIENYLAAVKKRDFVWFLGDICFTNEACELTRQLPGTKNLILGNHDTDRECDIEQLVLAFDNVHSLRSYKGFWLSHAPIHPKELRGRKNIHGHMHNEVIDDERYINVCLEHTDYKPKLFSDIVEETSKNNN